jgi:transcription antitermination factor NusG
MNADVTEQPVGVSDAEAAGPLAAGSLWPATLGLWHVLHVKSRQEKILSDDLLAMGIAHYLPLMRQVRFHGGRKAVVEMPLFPGYVFLRGTLDEAYRADRTRRVARIIPVANQQRLDWELRNLDMALSHRVALDPYPFLSKGVRVEVRSGPLRGLQGVIGDRRSSSGSSNSTGTRADRLILQVQMLGTATSLEIDGAILDPLD